MNKKERFSFLVISKGGVPLYSFPRMEEKQEVFSSLVSAITALGSDVLGEKSKREKLEYHEKILLLLEKASTLFVVIIPQKGEEKQGWELLERLSEKFIRKFGADADWLSTHIDQLKQFDEIAKKVFERTVEFEEVDQLLEDAERMLKEIGKASIKQRSMIQKAKEIAEDVGIITTGILSRQLAINEEDLKAVIIPQLDLVPSREKDTYYTPNFWKERENLLRALLKEKKRLTVEEIKKRLKLRKADIPRLLSNFDVLIKEGRLYHRSFLRSAQRLLDKRKKTSIKNIAQDLNIEPSEFRRDILPHLQVVQSKRSDVYYGKQFWKEKKKQLKEEIKASPIQLDRLPEQFDILPEDKRHFVKDANLLIHRGTVYFNEEQLTPALEEKFAEKTLTDIREFLTEMSNKNETVALQTTQSAIPILKEKMKQTRLETIGTFFKQGWWMDDETLLKLAQETSSVLKKKLESASLEKIRRFIENLSYSSIKVASKIVANLKQVFKDDERFRDVTLSEVKNFLYQLNLVNEEVTQEVVASTQSFIDEEKVLGAKLSEVGWFLHHLKDVDKETALDVIDSIQPNLTEKIKHSATATFLDFLKPLEEFPEGIVHILESSENEILSTLKHGSNEEKLKFIDLLKSTAKARNEDLFKRFKDKIMDYVYINK